MKDFFNYSLNGILIYIVIINLITFAAFGIDKFKAKHHRYRISERTLFILCFLGGSPGGFLGMKTFHHKTLHNSFKFGVPTIFSVELFAVMFFIIKLHQ